MHILVQPVKTTIAGEMDSFGPCIIIYEKITRILCLKQQENLEFVVGIPPCNVVAGPSDPEPGTLFALKHARGISTPEFIT